MQALERIAKNYQELNLNDLMRALFLNNDFTDYIIELNTIEQLFNRGIDSTGDSIGEYTIATINGTKNFLGKIQKGQPYDRVTLKDTGAFYESFRVMWDNGDMVITSNPIKDGSDLLKQWGRDIIGLTDESLAKLREKALPILIRYTKEQLLKQAA